MTLAEKLIASPELRAAITRLGSDHFEEFGYWPMPVFAEPVGSWIYLYMACGNRWRFRRSWLDSLVPDEAEVIAERLDP